MSATKEKDIDALVGERFEGDYVAAEELMHVSQGIRVTIESVTAPNTERDARKKLIDKPILVLKGTTKNKKLIVSKTNYRVLWAMLGKKPSGWVGKEITLAVRYLKRALGQDNLPCVRIIPPKGQPIPRSAYQFMGRATPYTEGEIEQERE